MGKHKRKSDGRILGYTFTGACQWQRFLARLEPYVGRYLF